MRLEGHLLAHILRFTYSFEDADPMNASILGISGSPIPDSNTDRAIRFILEESGLDYEFVKLTDYAIEPCRACLGCLETNQCVVKDDGRLLAEKFRMARGFVLGGYTPYSSLDARTKTFMERMYCLRHKTGLNRGKAGAAVITSACAPDNPQLPPAVQTARSQIAFWMMEEGIENLGTLAIMGNVPCIRCGYGDQCEMSGVRMLHGPQATVASVGVHGFQGNPALEDSARALAGQLRARVLADNGAH
jgi:multimeric flavodoxin WrbA